MLAALYLVEVPRPHSPTGWVRPAPPPRRNLGRGRARPRCRRGPACDRRVREAPVQEAPPGRASRPEAGASRRCPVVEVAVPPP
jgi:hypothetical protein